MTDLYFKMTKDFTKTFDKYGDQEKALMKARQEWFKQEFNLDFKTFYQFTDRPMFTDEQLKAIPHIKEICTKTSDYRQLNRTNKESKRLTASWKDYLKNKNLDQYVKANKPDPAANQIFLVRNAFPNGRVSFTRDKNNQIVCSTNCSKENINMTLVETELTRKDYLEIDLAYEKQLEKEQDA